MRNIIEKLLIEAYTDKKIISVTTQFIEWDASIVGYIVCIDDNYFTINALNEFGVLLGNHTIAIREVRYVISDSCYIRNLSYILSKRSSFDHNARESFWKKGHALVSHFQYLKDNEKISRFYFEDDNFAIGILMDFDKECLLIEDIGQDGSRDGFTCHKICDVIGLRYNDLEEQKITLLLQR